MITYNWNCRTVDAYVQDGAYKDLVYRVQWELTGTSDVSAISVTTAGTQGINVSDVANFIPFNNLTNETVVGWTKKAMGEYQVAIEEAIVADKIEQFVNPVSVRLTISEIQSANIVEEPTPVSEPLPEPVIV